jgi:hypothetical protein
MNRKLLIYRKIVLITVYPAPVIIKRMDAMFKEWEKQMEQNSGGWKKQSMAGTNRDSTRNGNREMSP